MLLQSRSILLIAIVSLLLPLTASGNQRDDAPRIVTLAPALSQMLVDLDMADHIVGAASYDDVVRDGLPVVGGFQDIDTERLLSLRPTHVLTMTTSNDPPARLRELAEAGRFELVSYRYPDTIDQVLDILHHDTQTDGPRRLGELLNIPQRAEQLKRRTRNQLDALRELTAERTPPKVLIVIGTGPVTASGPDTVNHELLAYAGGVNAAGEASVMAPTYDREALIALAPEVIVLMLPGAPPLTDGDARLAEFAGLPIPAVERGRIHLLNDPLIVLPSTNLPQVGLAMARAIHPALDEALRELEASFAEASERAP
ncbi:MAG: ABC transporter substrate-binding protein [Phycisphaeraceae bacterium]